MTENHDFNRKEYLREQFFDAYGKEPEEVLDDYDPSERDLEIALRLKKDELFEIMLLMNAEQHLNQIDEDHLSQESQDDIQRTKSQIRFNKKVVQAKFGMEWSRIKDLFITGQYDKLEDAYSEDWDVDDLATYDG